VRVNATLTAASRERTEEHYEPSKTALRSEHRVEEAAGAGDPGVAGVPGAQTNLPDALPEGAEPAEARAGAGEGGALRRSHTRNWEVDRITEKVTTPPGGIERLSVAVLLNGRWEQRGANRAFVQRSAEEVSALTELVKRAVGFDAERGDSVEVKAMKFTELPAADPGVPLSEPAYQRWLPYALAGAAALLLGCSQSGADPRETSRAARRRRAGG
jgi:flagellar M-ring protein FliF